MQTQAPLPPVDRVFHALAGPTRRSVLEALSQRSASISEVAAPLGITLAAVVQHVQVLEQSGLVRTEMVGRVRSCRLDPTGLSLAERRISERRSLREKRFDRLADVLDETDGQAT